MLFTYLFINKNNVCYAENNLIINYKKWFLKNENIFLTSEQNILTIWKIRMSKTICGKTEWIRTLILFCIPFYLGSSSTYFSFGLLIEILLTHSLSDQWEYWCILVFRMFCDFFNTPWIERLKYLGLTYYFFIITKPVNIQFNDFQLNKYRRLFRDFNVKNFLNN